MVIEWEKLLGHGKFSYSITVALGEVTMVILHFLNHNPSCFNKTSFRLKSDLVDARGLVGAVHHARHHRLAPGLRGWRTATALSPF